MTGQPRPEQRKKKNNPTIKEEKTNNPSTQKKSKLTICSEIAGIVGLVVAIIGLLIAQSSNNNGSGVQLVDSTNTGSISSVVGDNSVSVAIGDYSKVEIKVSPTEKPMDLSYSNSIYSQGQELLKQALYQDALAVFDEALQYQQSILHSDIDTARIYCAQGIAYKCIGNYQESIKIFTKAIGIVANLAKEYAGVQYELGYIYYLRAIVYEQNGQLSRALEDLQKSMEYVELRDENAEAPYSKSSLYCLLGRIRYSSIENGENKEGEVLGFTCEDAYAAFCQAIDQKNLYFAKTGRPGVIIKNWGQVIYGNQPQEKMYFYDEAGNQVGSSNFMVHEYVVEEPDREIAEILIYRSIVLEHLTYYQAVIDDCKAAIEIYGKMDPTVTDQVGLAYKMEGFATLKNEYFDNGKKLTDEIRKEFYELMKRYLEWSINWTGESVDTARAYESVAYAALLKEDYEEALQQSLKAKEIYEKLNVDIAEVNKKIAAYQGLIDGKTRVIVNLFNDKMIIEDL